MNPGALGVRIRRASSLLATMAFALLLLAAPAHATFPGKNGKIAYTDGNHLFLINPDGTGASQVPTPSRGVYPRWSADGSTLVFQGGSGIAFVKPDGSGYSTFATPLFPTLTSWSPDSSKLTFDAFSSAPPNFHIYAVNADSTGPTELTRGAVGDPKWSPNGERILFMQGESSGAPGLYTMTPEGRNINKVQGTGLGDVFGDWSPDGQRIAFQRFQDVYSIGVDGSNLVQITSDSHSYSPAWSPDGTKIVFVSSLTGHGEISVMNADGSGQTQLTNTTGGVILPDWQPIPGPQRSDYKNANKFCKAEQAFWGDQFRQHYRNFGQCVSSSK